MGDKKRKGLLIGLALLITFVGNVFILRILPKLIAGVFSEIGYPLHKEDKLTLYLMGIAVRIIGLLLFFIIIRKLQIDKWYTWRIKRNYWLISWMFFVYIFMNLEVVSCGDTKWYLILLMIIENLMIGIYEEMVYRGLILPLFLKEWGTGRKQVLGSVIGSSVMFGLIHLFNLTGAHPYAVISQVFYAAIMGVIFSAIMLRTNWNLLWCAILHGLYDMAAGFGDLAQDAVQEVPQKLAGSNAGVVTEISVWPYVINVVQFVPLLLFAFFLLRKVSGVSGVGKVSYEIK